MDRMGEEVAILPAFELCSFLKIFIYFNWRLITLQYCSGFCHLEKEMATHSSVLAWSIPGTGEPDGLLSMGSHRVGHD